MLDIKYVRQNLEVVKKALAVRASTADLKTFEACDKQRRTALLEIEELRHRRNVVSDQIADMKKKGENADNIVAEMRDVSSRIKTLEKALAKDEETVRDIIMGLPNIPDASVPVGKDDTDCSGKSERPLNLVLLPKPIGI